MLQIVELLLQHGANVDARDKNQYTPLHFAAQYGQIEVAKLLLDYGANKDLEDQYGWTPLHIAMYYREGEFQQVVDLLENNN